MHNPSDANRGSGLAVRLLTRVLVLLGAVALTGCQMDSADADLPPVRLTPPTILGCASCADRQAPIAPLPTMPKPVATAQPPAVNRVPAASSAGIPAGWIPAVPANHWTWIIIHHSDSDYGSAAIIDKWHRDRGFDEFGYHFVIGNGTNSGDGQVEVGPRWTKQKWGAHDNALDNRYNINGIGICLVGNFNNTRPTAKQIHSLVRLVAFLMGKYDIPADRILGHGETKVTQCPGRNMNVAEIREEASRLLAEGDQAASPQYADRR